jgi:hypothetical protein
MCSCLLVIFRFEIYQFKPLHNKASVFVLHSYDKNWHSNKHIYNSVNTFHLKHKRSEFYNRANLLTNDHLDTKQTLMIYNFI